MGDMILESERSLEVVLSCDVLVAGGGIAGIAAAIAAARGGKNVILLEREYALGGMATLGLVTIYLPLCDGEGNQLVFGIGEELLKLSIEHGAEANYPDAWLNGGSLEERVKNRYITQFNPHLFALSAEALLCRLGVTVLYGTLACAVRKDGNAITHVVVENKSGRSAIAVESVIDCTGDADICRMAGARTVLHAKGNILASWYYFYKAGKVSLKMFGLADVAQAPPKNAGSSRGAADASAPSAAAVAAAAVPVAATQMTATASKSAEANAAATNTPAVAVSQDGGGSAYKAAMTRSLDDNLRFSGVDGEELSGAVIAAHSKMYEDILKLRAEDESYVPVTMSTIPLVRMSRRLAGAYAMDESEDHKRMEDSIGMTGDWRKRGPAFEIPFMTLYGHEVKNLLAAGRDISVTDAMWDITRVIPPCAVTGEAAGTAAAMGSNFAELNVGELQARLAASGVKLHLDDQQSLK